MTPDTGPASGRFPLGRLKTGLAIAEGVKVKKIRRFPLTGSISVKPGDIVTPDTLLGHQRSDERLHVMKIDAADGKISGMIVRQPGDSVKKGEAIALSTYAMGLGLTEFCSPVDGQVVSIDTITGTVVVREHPEPLRALIPGVVAEIIGDEAVVIETCGAYIEGMFGSGFSNGARLAVPVTSGDACLNPNDIGYKYAGCIAVIGAECRHEHLMAALRGRMIGVIAGGGDLEAIKAFVSFVSGLSREEYEARFGGQRNIRTIWEDDGYIPGLSIVLTEGFGTLPIRAEVFAALKKRQNQYAYLDIPGAYSELDEPPQIIIPQGDPRGLAPSVDRTLKSGLVPGARVRLLGPARFGLTAVVEELPTELFPLPSGIKVPAVTVRLADGQVLAVPARNVELV